MRPWPYGAAEAPHGACLAGVPCQPLVCCRVSLGAQESIFRIAGLKQPLYSSQGQISKKTWFFLTVQYLKERKRR